jgi:hypothetical protein
MRRLFNLGLWLIALASMAGVVFGVFELVAYKIDAQRQFVDPAARNRLLPQ